MSTVSATDPEPASLPAVSGAGLSSRTFVSLLVTHALGTINDNMFRWLVIGIGKSYMPQHVPAILSVGLALFVLPYLLLAAPAGYLADRFSKRRVIVVCKVAEIVIMAAGVVAILLGNLYGLFLVLFVMGGQSALFGPAKFGSIPEMLRSDRISAANGALGLCTVVATVVGTVAGNALYMLTRPYGVDHLWVTAVALIGTAALGTLTSLGIARLKAADLTLRFPWNPVARTYQDLKILAADGALMRVALGLTFFWTLGSLCQMNIDQFGMEGHMLTPDGQPNQMAVVPLLISLIVGVGFGSVLAGIWSAGKVELGILPLGAGGIAIAAILLFTVRGDLVTSAGGFTGMSYWACAWLLLLGVSAGLFDVPLEAYLQARSPRKSLGAVLAAANFMMFGGMLLAAALFAQLKPIYTARQIFLFAGCLTVPVFVYVVWLLPQASIRFFVWLLSHTIYRLRVYGREHLPDTGGALLVPNHPTWIDGIFLLLASSRPIRMIGWGPNVESWWARWACHLMGVIPITTGPKAARFALETARKAVLDGELVCIFAEGTISRDGFLQVFKPGMLRIVGGTDVPVIPVYLDELWGSVFSYQGGRAFWKWPRHWPYPVTILFGKPIEHPEDVRQVRRGVELLGLEAIQRRKPQSMNLPRAFLKACRRARFRSKVADSSGADLSGSQLLARTLVLRRLLLREVLAARKEDEQYVGVLLPPSVAAAAVNAAVPLCGRTVVNLNYTLTSDVMNFCIRRCDIRHVLTSRRFMQKMTEKTHLKVDAELVYLEDFAPRATRWDKIVAGLGAYLAPLSLLARMLKVQHCDPDDVFTVIFTSGSTGEPKGVMLTYENISTNVAAIDQVVHLRPDDVVLGVLPFFHSFGFTITLWTVFSLDLKGIYHFSPLEPRPVGKLCRQHGATVLLSTPTFLRGFLRRCEPEDFRKAEVVVTGAEKLPRELADAFEKKFGVRPVEGYGSTELSPLVSVNIPPSRAVGDPALGIREGSVGRCVPHVMAKVVDLESGAELAPSEPGMLLVKGPNVMRGYLGRDELTAEVMRDGWYVTGDIAKIDPAGFIEITGRESRFSKIGGEMVPHMLIEDMLGQLLSSGTSGQGQPTDGEHDQPHVAVTAVPDAQRGERIVVVHTRLDKTPQEICRALTDAGLPRLWTPDPENFLLVDVVPVLGTGKLDLRALKELALQRFAT